MVLKIRRSVVSRCSHVRRMLVHVHESGHRHREQSLCKAAPLCLSETWRTQIHSSTQPLPVLSGQFRPIPAVIYLLPFWNCSTLKLWAKSILHVVHKYLSQPEAVKASMHPLNASNRNANPKYIRTTRPDLSKLKPKPRLLRDTLVNESII